MRHRAQEPLTPREVLLGGDGSLPRPRHRARAVQACSPRTLSRRAQGMRTRVSFGTSAFLSAPEGSKRKSRAEVGDWGFFLKHLAP